jgi:hypothetical protein
MTLVEEAVGDTTNAGLLFLVWEARKLSPLVPVVQVELQQTQTVTVVGRHPLVL